MSTTSAALDLSSLNPTQLKAVTTTEGPVLIVAGPGSGKTRVLTYRIAHLLQQGTKPWEILALTFTNKAAREMKERIEKVVGPSVNSVWAGTFHSIFARILRVEAKHLGYPSNFTIYDTDDTKSVIKAVIKEMNLNKEHYNVNSIKNRISMLKSNLIPPKAYVDRAELMDEDARTKRPHFHKVYAKYVLRCKRAGAMDFDDLLFRLYELLQNHPEVRHKYQQKFRYVMVDEFQDTNHLQYAIVRKLLDYRKEDGSIDHSRPRNIAVVGDDAQSIYAFRGATIQNILDFEADFKPFGIQVFKLEQNYRSTSHIVEAANEIITYNKKQIKKKIVSEKGAGERIRLIKAMSDNEEGKRVADTILEQKNRYHLSNRDIGILYRTNAQSRIFEEYLRRYNIAYKVFGGLSFYQRKEVKDLIAYLRLAVNINDEEALRRSINYPRRGIGDTTLAKISAAADQQGVPMYEAIPQFGARGRTKTSLAAFVQMMESFRKKAATTDAYETAIFVARQSGLIDLLKQDTTIEGINRLENIQSLLDGIKEFVEDDSAPPVGVEGELAGKSLAAYIQNIALLTDQDEAVEERDFVTLMSVHAAKGLEFKSVFVVGLEEKLFPSFMSMDSAEAIDEERRLFYVAITRAEAFLTISYAVSRYHHGQMRYNEPSRFLAEIDLSHLQADAPVNNVTNGRFGRGGMGTTAKATTQRSGVRGNFKRRGPAKPAFKIDPKTFRPNHPSEIKEGQQVLHLRFGKGQVTKVEGARDKKVATIIFEGDTEPDRRLMLKFAKLQIVEG